MLRDEKSEPAPEPGVEITKMHEVKVLEIRQTSSNTYLKISEGHLVYWIAAVKTDAKPGDVFYFDEALQVSDFKSAELDTTFASLYMIRDLKSTLDQNEQVVRPASGTEPKPNEFREDIRISRPAGVETIARILEDRDKFSGKEVLLKGQVIKVNNEVMGRNWIHIQDGTRFGEAFDLTVTSAEFLTVGQIVTFKGILNTEKDFGAGYFYPVILEDAVMVADK
jgi:hypothetical protein